MKTFSENKTSYLGFIKYLNTEFEDVLNKNDWKIEGKELTLSVRNNTIENIIKEKFEAQFKVQIWVASQDFRKVRCSFEIAENKNKVKLREKIADRLRELIGLEDGILESKGSTIIRTLVDIENGINYKDEINKIIDFYRILNESLLDPSKIEDALKDIKE